MKRKYFQLLLGAAVCLTITFGTAIEALAQRPEPVVRSFMVLYKDAQGPDFLSEQSHSVTVLPFTPHEVPGSILQLADAAVNGQFRNTDWVQQPAHHAVAGSGPDYPYFWLLTPETPDPPPVGTHTFTGPRGVVNGYILDVQYYYLHSCSDGAVGLPCSGQDISNGAYYISDSPTGADGQIVVVTAVFSR